ncbi:MAG: hypothetical protein KAX49_10995 [Halanaerobiales bacterium]|nr:hypothetical protein [Halanaerobiales bacterium]
MIDGISKKHLEPFQSSIEVLGIVLVGSASKSYTDLLSDYDLEVIVTDSYYDTLDDDQKFYEIEEEKLEFLILPESDFLAKIDASQDVEHWPYETFQIIYDTNDYLEEKLIEIISIKPEIREKRLKLHYFEFLFCAQRIERTLMRGNEFNVLMVSAKMNMALIKLLFLLNYRWPPLLHWAMENLEEIDGIPQQLKSMMLESLRKPNAKLAKNLIREVDELLLLSGIEFQFVKTQITTEISSPEFRLIRDKYGVL